MRMPFIAGNWKMFKTTAEAISFAEKFISLYTPTDIKVAVFAPYTQLSALVEAFKGTAVHVGAQNMHFEEEGAYTGEISPLMLKELGVTHCIIGHSERRQFFGEDDESCNKKLHSAFSHNIFPVFCIGENLEQREADNAFSVVEKQLVAGLKDISKDTRYYIRESSQIVEKGLYFELEAYSLHTFVEIYEVDDGCWNELYSDF